VGDRMPPPAAVTAGKAKPLTDEDRRTLARWIDLGCPIDLDFDPAHPDRRGFGWMLDDNRPVLALTLPAAGANAELSRVLVGMHDYGSGVESGNFQVTASVELDGVPAGADLAPKFRKKSQGVWEWRLAKPVTDLPQARLTVTVADRQGNVTRVERTFSVGR